MIKGIECPYIISKLSEHDLIKEDILDLINDAESNRYTFPEHYTDITRTDWNVSRDVERQYLNLAMPPIVDLMEKRFLELGYNEINIHNVWFQQYRKGSEHGWHVHLGCQFTSVYYVDLPEGAPKTQLLNPMNQKDIIELDVKEGDVLTFPSFILHRAPNVESNIVKTIISFNSDCNIKSVAGLYDF
jgi:hypothetical protein